jgi:hypothetical protein
MNLVDKFCGVLAFALGAVLLVLGVFGLFVGCNAHFTLPPILGVIPALVGWGIVRAVWIAWRAGPPGDSPPLPHFDRPPADFPDGRSHPD